MTDRVYPAGKPNPPPGAMNGGAGAGPAKTTQLYNPNRPRPVYQPNRRSDRSCTCRRCCCLCILYTIITLLFLLLIAAIAAGIFYFLYHPKHPTFSVSSIRISKFNLTTAGDPSAAGFSHLTSRIDVTVTAKNPNKKQITFVYDAVTVDVRSGGVDVGGATVPGFAHVAGNTTILRATLASDPTRDLDSDSVGPLKASLGKKTGFPMTAVLNTKVEVRVGKMKSKGIGIRVTCDGIRGFQPKNATSKNPTPGTTSDARCKVDLRIKIWKFTF